MSNISVSITKHHGHFVLCVCFTEVTCDVDVTITNILEGRVPFPEEKKSIPNIGDGNHIANNVSVKLLQWYSECLMSGQ